MQIKDLNQKYHETLEKNFSSNESLKDLIDSFQTTRPSHNET